MRYFRYTLAHSSRDCVADRRDVDQIFRAAAKSAFHLNGWNTRGLAQVKPGMTDRLQLLLHLRLNGLQRRLLGCFWHSSCCRHSGSAAVLHERQHILACDASAESGARHGAKVNAVLGGKRLHRRGVAGAHRRVGC
ncbi:hypothetical protein D3C80_1571890 [compost metagenome]